MTCTPFCCRVAAKFASAWVCTAGGAPGAPGAGTAVGDVVATGVVGSDEGSTLVVGAVLVGAGAAVVGGAVLVVALGLGTAGATVVVDVAGSEVAVALLEPHPATPSTAAPSSAAAASRVGRAVRCAVLTCAVLPRVVRLTSTRRRAERCAARCRRGPAGGRRACPDEPPR
ncbi:hypothetical protein GCM10027047_16260 [Rhodococcus aerolatus]